MAPPFRLVSYNVRYFGHALKGLASTLRSQQAISTGLAMMRPAADIICLQEVETASIRSRIGRRRAESGETQLASFMDQFQRAALACGQPFPYEAFYFRAHAYRLGRAALYTTGLAVIVNTDRLTVEQENSAAPTEITHRRAHRRVKALRRTKQSRICAHVALRSPGGVRFHIFNTHLSLPTPFARDFWRSGGRMGHGPNQIAEAQALTGFVERSAAAEPFIICGDFNSAPGSPVYQCFTKQDRLLSALTESGRTRGNLAREFPTAGFMRLRMHLDHIFHSPEIQLVDVEGTAPFGDGSSPFHRLSDHVPLVARFKLD